MQQCKVLTKHVSKEANGGNPHKEKKATKQGRKFQANKRNNCNHASNKGINKAR